ncbi:hypothetical protein [Myroides sp. N17-2]|uniref:hypothetical protein n=1 Tax=Myroides sp. N17-2 TaxID=2030799 RepID=UPI000EFCD593|nr:hypothetical protein [Myroides sp. N17-2]
MKKSLIILASLLSCISCSSDEINQDKEQNIQTNKEKLDVKINKVKDLLKKYSWEESYPLEKQDIEEIKNLDISELENFLKSVKKGNLLDESNLLNEEIKTNDFTDNDLKKQVKAFIVYGKHSTPFSKTISKIYYSGTTDDSEVTDSQANIQSSVVTVKYQHKYGSKHPLIENGNTKILEASGYLRVLGSNRPMLMSGSVNRVGHGQIDSFEEVAKLNTFGR